MDVLVRVRLRLRAARARAQTSVAECATDAPACNPVCRRLQPYVLVQVTDELVDVLLTPLLSPGAADVVFDTLSYSAGMCMCMACACAWHVHGMCTACARHVHGMCMVVYARRMRA